MSHGDRASEDLDYGNFSSSLPVEVTVHEDGTVWNGKSFLQMESIWTGDSSPIQHFLKLETTLGKATA